jgi:hypothetical protein
MVIIHELDILQEGAEAAAAAAEAVPPQAAQLLDFDFEGELAALLAQEVDRIQDDADDAVVAGEATTTSTSNSIITSTITITTTTTTITTTTTAAVDGVGHHLPCLSTVF